MLAIKSRALRRYAKPSFRAAATASMIITAAWTSSSAQPLMGHGVDDAVSQAEASGASVRVVVALSDAELQRRTAGLRLDTRDGIAERQRIVADLQEAVLRSLPRGSAAVATAYQSVPALVLDVRSKAGLVALQVNRGVVMIDFDGGAGSGGLDRTVPLVGGSEWHAVGSTGAGVVVGILDSGIDTDHPDFSGAVIFQACFADFGGDGRCPNGATRQFGPGAAEDDHDHGTHVAGIIASRGVDSSVGMAPGVSIVAVKVLDSTNSFGAFSEIVAGLDYVLSNPQLGVKVINMSLGTNALYGPACDYSTAWTFAGALAVNALRAQGVSVFASAMNDFSNSAVAVPACLSAVVAVGATTLTDNLAAFSNSSSSVQILAPGVGVVSSRRGGGRLGLSGTSMASPHVAGCAALLQSGGAATTPADGLSAMIESSTVLITDPDNGLQFPRLDCFDQSLVAASSAPLASAGQLSFGFPRPNPTSGVAHVDVLSEATQRLRIDLLDALARKIDTLFDGLMDAGEVATVSSNLEHVSPGMYWLRATTDTGAISTTQIVRR